MNRGLATKGYYSRILGQSKFAEMVIKCGVVVAHRPANMWFDEKKIRLLFDEYEPVTGLSIGDIVRVDPNRLLPMDNAHEQVEQYSNKVFEVLAFFVVNGEVRQQGVPFGKYRCRFEDRYCAVANYGDFGLEIPHTHVGTFEGKQVDFRIHLIRAAALLPIPETTT